MFENVLGQGASVQLRADIETGVLPRAMLFSGPEASGKGTAALELSRVLSCEDGHVKAAWNCGCSACSRHRFLIHSDLLCLGRTSFSSEIAASASAFLGKSASLPRAENPAARLLFVRAVRKLLLRFNPVLWEDEPKAAKLFSLVNSLEEDLSELEAASGRPPETKKSDALAKLVEGILKSAFKLESEGLAENIPISQIRSAAFWGRLAPGGNAKLIVIEGVERTQNEARNALLKILEEPPPRLSLVLTTSKPGSLPSTILSRLRLYRFYQRDADMEEDVIRRVFRDETSKAGIRAYLDSFLPVSRPELEALASLFASSVAYRAAAGYKKQGRDIPEELMLLGKHCAAKAESAGLGRPRKTSPELIDFVIERGKNFEPRSLFSGFLCSLLEQSFLSQKKDETFLPSAMYHETWMKCSNYAESAVGTYNLSLTAVLEKLYTDLSGELSQL